MLFILVVCTGNVCRSPIGEFLWRRALTNRGLVDGTDVYVASAGTGVWGDGTASIANGSRLELHARGINATGFTARRLTADELAAADLVITMEAEHVRRCAELLTDARNRTFTLRELDELVADLPPQPEGAPPPGLTVLADLVAARQPLPLTDDRLDVPDPIGGTLSMFASTANEIEARTERIATALWGPSAVEIIPVVTDVVPERPRGFRGLFGARRP